MSPQKDLPRIGKYNDFIVYNIGRLYVLLNQYLSAAYKEFGLNPAKFNLLMHIKHIGKDRGIIQNELGGKLYVSAANITKLIDGLEKRGWIERVPSREDRRAKLIKITLKGLSLLDKVWLRHVQALNSLLPQFSAEEKKKFNQFLERFKQEREVNE